ncbi:MauE/DoxX family redox-associated membrane protein [Actinoplanes flavus]|uniref:Methylamine utilisation protein MauE domain-containing protein n=1 Tax=Actinoplanes flavus TaxID=2820290 RepID=A0ABS3UF96_9ACTN|nr:MauE/DoxX family redox-associated membrane protein [Actinoplanes flavus]MBO3737440.1 hypothetical protein [Actinoplanes flavus]
MRVVTVICILLLTGVLAISLISKLRSRAGFTAFAGAVVDFGLAPRHRARPVAAAAVAAEMIVVAALFRPSGATVGLALAAALFAVFTVALATAVRRGSRAGCHCFGASSAPVSRRHVLRAALLCAVATGALAGPADPLTGLTGPQALAAAAVAAIGVAALAWLDEIVWLFRGATPVR